MPQDMNPSTPGATPADAMLGGYFDVHSRPPAFEGVDGLPYTVSMEIEKTGDLRKPVAGYLVFPRWAETGLGIIGHVETGILCEGQGSDEVREHLRALSLLEVQQRLDAAIQLKEETECSATD
jgi:hypothetical protein